MVIEADRFVGGAEVVKMLGVSRRTLKRLVAKGELPVIRRAPSYLFSVRQVAKYQDELRRAAERDAKKAAARN